jgi:hypothetical protein
MEAAVIETQLIMAVDAYIEEAIATGKYPLRKKGPKPIPDLTLFELISIAKAADWLPSGLDYAKDGWDLKRFRIGDFADLAREIRNLTHPGRYARDLRKKRVTLSMARTLIARDMTLQRSQSYQRLGGRKSIPNRKPRPTAIASAEPGFCASSLPAIRPTTEDRFCTSARSALISSASS